MSWPECLMYGGFGSALLLAAWGCVREYLASQRRLKRRAEALEQVEFWRRECEGLQARYALASRHGWDAGAERFSGQFQVAVRRYARAAEELNEL